MSRAPRGLIDRGGGLGHRTRDAARRGVAPAAIALLIALPLGACSGPLHGVATPVPVVGAPVARATASEPGGVRVLANGAGWSREEGAWLAGDDEALARLWKAAGARGPVPRVDFGTHVVLGTWIQRDERGGDDEYDPEVVAAAVDGAGVLGLEVAPLSGRRFTADGQARVVAVPRRILPPRFVFRYDRARAFGFSLPAPPPPRGAAARVDEASAAEVHLPPAAPRRGAVDLPARGTLALRSLPDGREVWVGHAEGGEVWVVSADQPSLPGAQRRPPEGLAEDPPPWLRAPVAWNADTGRFSTEHDWTGCSVHGDAGLEVHPFARAGAGRIEIGEAVGRLACRAGARAAAPALVGPAAPYTTLPAVESDGAGALPEGQLVRVVTPAARASSGPVRSCKVLAGTKTARYLALCDRGTFAVAGPGFAWWAFRGPIAVRRRGDLVDLAVGSRGVRASSRDGFLAPSPVGPTRIRGALQLDAPVHGDTRGAPNGFEPACTEAGGAPDEAWELVAPEAGRYAFQLDARYDAALALVDEGGAVLACNDDRHGNAEGSVAHVALARGARIRAVVDGFGGAAGPYELEVRREVPLAHGGELPLGVDVRGDTSRSTDDHGLMCSAPAPDQAYRLVVDVPGKYRFRIETPGWRPLFSITPEGNPAPWICGVARSPPPLPLVEELDLWKGAFSIVVDGPTVGEKGPYLLRVDRIGDEPLVLNPGAERAILRAR